MQGRPSLDPPHTSHVPFFQQFRNVPIILPNEAQPFKVAAT